MREVHGIYGLKIAMSKAPLALFDCLTIIIQPAFAPAPGDVLLDALQCLPLQHCN